jgi:adenylate cyclase
VWRDGTSVRINAQLIDGVSGSHLWADRYQGVLDKVFKLQDTIINNVLLSLRLELHKDAQVNHLHKETTNPAAYDYFLHGRHHFNRYASKEENAKARDLYWKAIELDREFAMAYAMLAWTYAFDAMNGWSEMRKASLDRAFELAMTAITLDEELPVAYFVIGLVYRERGEYLNASGEAKKAIRLEPSYANAYVLLGTLQYRTGALEEGLTQIKMAMRLNPHHPYNYPFHLGQAYYMLGQFPNAIQAFEQGLASNPSSERLHVWLAAAYLRAGRADDARWEAEQVLTLNPTFLLDRIEGTLPFDNLMDHERFLNNLRTAGLP